MAKKHWNKFFKKQNKTIIKLLEMPVWQSYKRLLKNENMAAKPRVIELGCGTGLISLLLAKNYNAKITLVDYSNSALNLAKKLFKKEGIKANFVKKDFFKLNLKNKFDLVHSQGVIEHFKDRKQKKLVGLHRKFLKKNGIAIILAPRPSIYYKLWRGIIEAIKGEWLFGYEKPIKKDEGIKLIKSQGLKIKKTTKSMLENGYLCTR